MKTYHAKLLSITLILLIGVSTSSCLLFQSSGNVHPDNEAFFLLASTIDRCEETLTDQGIDYICGFGEDGGDVLLSEFVLMNPLFVLFLVFFDPIIVQVPAGTTDFRGTITASNGMSVDMNIKAGFTTLPVDINNTMTAEPGMQLVILDFPEPMPFLIPDDFEISLLYQLPPGPGPFEIKVMAAGKVPTNEGTFYPPIFPCVNDFADVPALNIPVSVFPLDLDFSVYLDSPGCEGLVYDYTGLTPIQGNVRPIPTVSHWGLIAMAGVFGVIAVWAITRRRVAL